MRVLLNLLVSSAAVLVSARIMPGVTVDTFGSAAAVALILGGVNALLAPALVRLTFTVNRLRLAVLTFAVTGITVLITARLVPGFHVEGFRWALAFAVLLSAINSFFNRAGPSRPGRE